MGPTDTEEQAMECPACSAKKIETLKVTLFRCRACEALFGSMYLGDSYSLVKPYFDAPGACAPEAQRYFDFECVGSKGVTRRHGWFNPATGYTTQVG
jgi:hypothetical protein